MVAECRFTKMHGAGNDFIMINDMDGRCRLSLAAVAALCSRRRGIGGDGLILIRPSAAASFTMRYFNSDGGEAAMCGNGARCAAAFAHRTGIAGCAMIFESGAGLVSAEVLDDGVRVGIGSVRDLRLNLRIASSNRVVHCGVCGVPHAVLVESGARELPRDEFLRLARAVRSDPEFGAAGANVNAVSVNDPHRCSYRTYERGVEDETDACGTGAVVIATVLTHLGLAEPPIVCVTSGGDALEVDFMKKPHGADDCRLKGPVAVTFQGSFRTEDYERA